MDSFGMSFESLDGGLEGGFGSLATESNKLDPAEDRSLMLLGPFKMESSHVKVAEMTSCIRNVSIPSPFASSVSFLPSTPCDGSS